MAAQPEASSEGGAPEYMVSYADMLTIMLAFFVVLYASAGTTSSGTSKGEKTGDVEKSSAASGPKQGHGPKAGGGGKEGLGGDKSEGFGANENPAEADAQARKERLDKVFQSLHYRFGPDWTISNCWSGGPPQLRSLAPAKLDRGPGPKGNVRPSWPKPGNDAARARGPRPGDHLLVGGRIYFGEFSADLTEPEMAKLRKAAEELAGKLQRIEIRGHSSRRPLPKDSSYRDSWDLAYDRCRKVKDFLVAQGIDPKRIRLGVAGDNEPQDSGADPLPTKPNSRVEIHILSEYVQSPEGQREVRPATAMAPPKSATPAVSHTGTPVASPAGTAKK
jgi:flagellar motor protein MotB